jgi:hypothetical protein
MGQFSWICHACGTAGTAPFLPEFCIACGVPAPAGPGVCRVCGCSQDDACWHDELGACEWAEVNLCSFCVGIAAGDIEREAVEQPADRFAFQAEE